MLSIPSQMQGLTSKSKFCSLIDCAAASVNPPILAKILPKYDALSKGVYSREVKSISLPFNTACNSSNVIT